MFINAVILHKLRSWWKIQEINYLLWFMGIFHEFHPLARFSLLLITLYCHFCNLTTPSILSVRVFLCSGNFLMGKISCWEAYSELCQTSITERFVPFMHNNEKWLNFKILRCENRKLFKVCWAIFLYYAWKG